MVIISDEQKYKLGLAFLVSSKAGVIHVVNFEKHRLPTRKNHFQILWEAYVIRNLPHTQIEIDSFTIHQKCRTAADFRDSYLLVSI